MIRARTLREIVTGRPMLAVNRHDPVIVAAQKMAAVNAGAVLVTEMGRLVGIFTERDLLIRVVSAHRDPETTKMYEVMTTRLVTGHPDESYITAIDLMVQKDCRHLPVVEGDRPVGMVSRRELMALDIKDFELSMSTWEPSAQFI